MEIPYLTNHDTFFPTLNYQSEVEMISRALFTAWGERAGMMARHYDMFNLFVILLYLLLLHIMQNWIQKTLLQRCCFQL